MDYARIKAIAERHHLEMSYPLYDAMKQAAGEAAQEMRAKYLDCLHGLRLSEEILTKMNREVAESLRPIEPYLKRNGEEE
jgi:hypothetical protein